MGVTIYEHVERLERMRKRLIGKRLRVTFIVPETITGKVIDVRAKGIFLKVGKCEIFISNNAIRDFREVGKK